MRNLIIVLSLIIMVFIIACESKSDLQVQDIYADVYYQEDYWDMTVSALISGLHTDESLEQRTVYLSYDIDFISPTSERIEDVDSGTIEEVIAEGTDNIEIEVTLFIDEGFQTGEYKLIINVSNQNTLQAGSGETTFVLDDDQKPNGP